MRDDLRRYVVERLGETDAVWVVDGTGDLKGGAHTVGVQRQYTGTAGRIENAQVAVYLTYASTAGHVLIDRELSVPRVLGRLRHRPARARRAFRQTVKFATKPALATEMITRALDAGVSARWVAGDEVYGADPKLRKTLEDRSVGYVLAVDSDSHLVRTQASARSAPTNSPPALPRNAWQRLSAGNGSHGATVLRLGLDQHFEPERADTQGQRWLLIRRNNATGELAYYRCWSPAPH